MSAAFDAWCDYDDIRQRLADQQYAANDEQAGALEHELAEYRRLWRELGAVDTPACGDCGAPATTGVQGRYWCSPCRDAYVASKR